MGDVVRWLYGLERFGVKLGLETMERSLDAFGRPDRAAPAILVGGTNGKGSVAAFLDAILRCGGRRVGLYTSPHLVRVNERIRIDGSDIDDASLALQLLAVRRHAEASIARGDASTPPSFFEAITTTALLAFRAARVDVEVLEVGLGGRLDATNVVDALVSVVVSIDLDHTDRLGTTIPRIAFEKAGIIKPGRVLVSGVAREDAVTVLREECERRGAAYVAARERARIVPQADGAVTVETPGAVYRDLRPGLSGAHQLDNARVAIVAAEELARAAGFPLPPGAVRDGLASARWPGRLQWIYGDPPILLDGAHNPAGAQALARTLRDGGQARPVLLFGAVAGKDVEGILAPLAGLVSRVIVTRPKVTRALSAEELVPAARSLGVETEAIEDPIEALARARGQARDSYVLVAGSLYLVGEILAHLQGSTADPISM